MTKKVYLFMLIGCTIIAACNHDENRTVAVTTAPHKPVVMEPFRFHEKIEVSPGQDYDILSWGRGAKSVGAFLILHSDSSAMKYTTTTGDLDGDITDAYNADMDMDGNPEILIQSKAKDSTSYANIYAFEFNNSRAEKLIFPKLTSSQKKGYRGGDNFYIKEGKFMREFPIYEGNGKDAKQTSEKRLLEYGLRNNSFTVKQLSKDAVIENEVKPAVKEPEKKSPSKKKETTQKKTKKHKSAEHKSTHKKKRRHRR